jgi:proteic killer suppression protein
MGIRSFKHKPLADLWNKGRAVRKLDARMTDRLLRLLDRLEQADTAQDMDFAGTRLHSLRGPKPTRYAVSVNGPWRLTFEFDDGDAFEVDLEQYH